MLTEQLWEPGLGDRVRTRVVPTGRTDEPDDGWCTAEEYWLLGGPQTPRLLVPVAPRVVQRAALTHYRGLRRPAANAGRALLGAAAGAGAPLARHRLLVQVRSPQDAALLPLTVLARALDRPRLHATFGVRIGANRKATLHLLDDDGTSVGHAKFGWNATADAYVRTESTVLTALARSAGPAVPGTLHAPGLLAALEQGGRPVVVVAPLPDDVRGARGSLGVPSAQEFYSLTPVVRTGPAASTAHLAALGWRVDALAGDDAVPASRAVLAAARDLLARVHADPRAVPIQARWHGDLTPWNCARGADSELWAWDWESSEPDVVAGLDVLHWHFSLAREAGALATVRLADCVQQGRAHLAAAGIAASETGLVQAVYALTVVERAASLALRDGGWDRVWISPERLGSLVAEARDQLVSAEPVGVAG